MGSTSIDKMIRPEFDVEKAPHAIAGLKYEELVAMIEVVSDPETDEEIAGYYGELIECSLPGAGLADLLLWPEEWFGDEKMSEVDLSSEEIANYLLAWTGVQVIGSEVVILPEIPESKRSGRK